jgi:hypothetical protein
LQRNLHFLQQDMRSPAGKSARFPQKVIGPLISFSLPVVRNRAAGFAILTGGTARAEDLPAAVPRVAGTAWMGFRVVPQCQAAAGFERAVRHAV